MSEFGAISPTSRGLCCTTRQGNEGSRENPGKNKPIRATTWNKIEPGHSKHLQHEQ